MIKNIIERTILIFFLGLVLLVTHSVSFGFESARRPDGDRKSAPEPVDQVELSFDSFDELALFDAYYSADGETAVKVGTADYWAITDGKLVAKTTNGYSSLIFKEYGFLNYEMTMEYQSDGAGNGYLALLSKMRKKGLSSRGTAAESYKEYGSGVFVRDNGTATLQGDFRSIGLTDEQGVQTATISGYDKLATHILRIRVFNDRYQLYVDEILTIDYVGGGGIGFMGIQSVDNAGSINHMTLTYLDNHGDPSDIMPKESVVRVAAVGDSLTFGSANGYYEINETTPGQLQTLLGDNYEVRNFGLGGRTAIKTSGSCILNDAEYELAVQYHADIIYIMLGTNDSQTTGGYWGAENPEQELIGANLFREGYQEIIDGLLEGNPNATVYLVVSPSFRHQGLPQLTEEMIAKRARVYTRLLAEENGFALIDANEVTKDLADSHLFDLIHYDSYGYGLIAQAIFSKIALDKNENPVLPYGLLDDNCLSLLVDETYDLSYTTSILPTYQSSNSEVVSIERDGKIQAVGVGIGIISATVGANTVRMKVVVKNQSVITNVSASSRQIYYGQNLPVLSAETNTAGTLLFPANVEITIGTKDYTWIFTPADSNYSIETGTISLTVKKGIPQIDELNIPTVEYREGLSLSDVQLPDNYQWVKPETKLSLGKTAADVVYMPTDVDHFESVRSTVELTVRLPQSAYENNEPVFGSIILGFFLGTFGVFALGGATLLWLKNKKNKIGGK